MHLPQPLIMDAETEIRIQNALNAYITREFTSYRAAAAAFNVQWEC